MTKKIMFGVLKCTVNVNEDKTADMELFDRTSGASLLVFVDKKGVVRFKETCPFKPITKRRNVKKALAKCFVEYDKVIA